jgi:alanyl-tRNA synthetase
VSTERLYWADSYLLEFDARVVLRLEHQGRPAVVLDRTAFYAESGGQPWDLGTLDQATVSAVVEKDGEVLHVLDRPLAADTVRGIVDAERRRDHRQQHHGQHLLSQALVELYSAHTISFHLGNEACSIDLDQEIDASALRAAETRTNEIVWDGRPVTVRHVSRGEAETLGLDPSQHVVDPIRLIEVKGFDLRPCGGTHPRSTSEVGMLVALGLERHKRGTRVHFVCGHRALAHLRRRGAILDAASAALSVSHEALVEAAQKLQERVAAADKRTRELVEWALEGEARKLLANATGAPPVVVQEYAGWPAQDLRTLAQKLIEQTACVALLGSKADRAHLVFACSPGLSCDVGALLRDALALVNGKGGGKGNLVQGGGERVDRLGEALDAAAAAARASS